MEQIQIRPFRTAKLNIIQNRSQENHTRPNLDIKIPCSTVQDKKEQAEAEIVPSSSLVELEFEVGVEVGVGWGWGLGKDAVQFSYFFGVAGVEWLYKS